MDSLNYELFNKWTNLKRINKTEVYTTDRQTANWYGLISSNSNLSR